MYEYTVLERGDAKDCRGLSTSGREKLMYNNRGRPWGGCVRPVKLRFTCLVQSQNRNPSDCLGWWEVGVMYAVQAIEYSAGSAR